MAHAINFVVAWHERRLFRKLELMETLSPTAFDQHMTNSEQQIPQNSESCTACDRSFESGRDVGGLRPRRWNVPVLGYDLVGPSRPGAGSDESWPHAGTASVLFSGLRSDSVGSFIGFFYGALTGALIGWVIAVVYNSVAGMREGEG